MNFINDGPDYSKGYNVYDIKVIDAVTLETLAYYTGYYNRKSRTFKLYPINLTDTGKKKGYRMEKQTISESQLIGF